MAPSRDGGVQEDADHDAGSDGGEQPLEGECRFDADCPDTQYCRIEGVVCPGTTLTVIEVPTPGRCTTPPCGTRSCEGYPCTTSDDCAPDEACGVFTPNVCEHRGYCAVYVECSDPACPKTWIPGPNCDFCLCEMCPDAG